MIAKRNIVMVTLVAAMVLVSPVMAAQPLTKVIMTTGSFSEREAAMYVAQDQGFFRRYGLELTFVQVRSGPVGMAAIASGETQLHEGSATAAVLSAAAEGLGEIREGDGKPALLLGHENDGIDEVAAHDGFTLRGDVRPRPPSAEVVDGQAELLQAPVQPALAKLARNDGAAVAIEQRAVAAFAVLGIEVDRNAARAASALPSQYGSRSPHVVD